MEKDTVVVTGITGFLGLHVVKLFLENGSFKVRGTLRSKSNQEKLAPIIKAVGQELFDQLELVEADLNDKESIIKACEGQKYVVHTASPFYSVKEDNEDELIKPAVSGTEAAMEGAIKAKSKRIVITSSMVAVMVKKDQSQLQFSPSDWTEEDACSGYTKSKFLAEKKAWDMQKELPEGEKIEIATVCPGFIMGPAFQNSNFTSGGMIKAMLLGAMPKIPGDNWPIVDVRDVAKAHLQAILVPEAANQRFLLSAKSMWMIDLAGVVAKTPHGKAFEKIPTEEGPREGVNARERVADTTTTKSVLGIDFIEIETTMDDMVKSFLESGFVEKP